jgi:hypothetical protein
VAVPRVVSIQKSLNHSGCAKVIYCAVPQHLIGDYVGLVAVGDVGYVTPIRMLVKRSAFSDSIMFMYKTMEKQQRTFGTARLGVSGDEAILLAYKNAISAMLKDFPGKDFANYITNSSHSTQELDGISSYITRNRSRIAVSLYDDVKRRFYGKVLHVSPDSTGQFSYSRVMQRAEQMRKESLTAYGESGLKEGFLVKSNDPRIQFV